MTAAGTGGTGGIEGWMKPGLNPDLEMKGGLWVDRGECNLQL